MMKKKCYIICLVALCLCFVATSCSKKDSSAQQQEMTQDFKALVMGGKDIDPNQTWSTAVNTPISISVNLEAGSTYTVYISETNPITSASPKYLGMAKLMSGESRTIHIAVPAAVSHLYASCYDSQGNVVCLPLKNNAAAFDNTNAGELTEKATEPVGNCMLYAFEFPGDNSIKDFDYNDLVLSVSAPMDNGDGTFTSSVNIVAIGSTRIVTVLYNNEPLGSEVHEAMGISKKSTINNSSFTREARRLGNLTFNSQDIDLGTLPFSVSIANSDGNGSQIYVQSGAQDAPLFMAINGDENGKWYWPREGTNIGLAYLEFSTWASNKNTATYWYHSSNGSTNQIVTW